MKTAKTTRIWVTSALLAAMVVCYGVGVITEAPSYWETFLFVTLLFLLFSIAIIRFVPYLLLYFETGK